MAKVVSFIGDPNFTLYLLFSFISDLLSWIATMVFIDFPVFTLIIEYSIPISEDTTTHIIWFVFVNTYFTEKFIKNLEQNTIVFFTKCQLFLKIDYIYHKHF